MEERTSGFKPVKKKKGRFNLVDLLLVIVALAVIFVVVFVIDPFSLNLFGGEEREITLEYTIRISNVDIAFVDKIAVGDEVVDSAVNTSLGYVSAVENDIPYSEPYYDNATDTVSMKEYPGRYDIMITVTAKAIFEDGVGYTVEGRRVAVGSQLYLMFPEYVGTGSCVSMREIG